MTIARPLIAMFAVLGFVVLSGCHDCHDPQAHVFVYGEDGIDGIYFFVPAILVVAVGIPLAIYAHFRWPRW